MKKYTSVEEFINDLASDKRDQVLALREIILKSNPAISEHIKWNAPSYILNNEDRITFNLHDEKSVKLILHMGAIKKENKKASPVLNDETGLIAWNSDIRGTLTFSSLAEIQQKHALIKRVLANWLEIN